jgi:hypothetical protein
MTAKKAINTYDLPRVVPMAPMPMVVATHRGINVEFDPKNSRFRAVVGGRALASTSLPGIKSAIDNKFAGRLPKPIPVLDCYYSEEKPIRRAITGVRHDGARVKFFCTKRKDGKGETTGVLDGVLRTGDSLFPDTPEGRRVIKALRMHDRYAQKVRDKLAADRSVLRNSCERFDADKMLGDLIRKASREAPVTMEIGPPDAAVVSHALAGRTPPRNLPHLVITKKPQVIPVGRKKKGAKK